METLVPPETLLFERFRLERSGGRLFKQDQNGAWQPVAIGSRAFDILAVLAERPGRLVPRAEIMAAAWPGIVVEDGNLAVQIAALRRILDRDRSDGSCIQTVPGRGYRFAVPVARGDGANGSAASASGHAALASGNGAAAIGAGEPLQPIAVPDRADHLRRARGRRRGSVASFGAALLVAAAALAAVAWHSSRVEPQPPRLSIAVLPFADLSPGHDQQYFADAVTGDLTTDLSRMGGMFVVSAESAMTYRGKAETAREIGRELDVRYVVEGSVERAGDRVRVNAQLIDAGSDAHLWAARFDRDFRGLFELQNEITGRIAFALNVEMIVAEGTRPIANPQAEDYIFRGREAFFGRAPAPKNYDEAIGWYERALALDPQSAAAKTWLAGALINRVFVFPTKAAPADLARAEKLIDEALAAGSRIPWAHYVKASVLRAKGQWAEAIPEFEAALALNRNMTGPLQGLGWCKLFTGARDEVIPLAEKGIRIGPRDPSIGFRYLQIAEVRDLQGRPKDAIGWFEKTRAAMPNYAGGRAHLAADYALTGDAERAAVEFAAARRMNPHLYSSLAGLRASQPWGVPKVEALFEATYFAGLRKAGMPEQ